MMRLFSVLLSCSCLLSAAVAVQPSFDARDVVRQVRSGVHPASGVERQALDEGEFLVDTSVTLMPTASDEGDPAVAFDGTNFLVVWNDGRGDGYLFIYGARVTQAGTLLDSTGIAISTADSGQSHAAVAFDGANFLVVWEDYRNDRDAPDIYGARVSPQGTVLDPDGIPISLAERAQHSPDLASDGSNILVVWHDERGGTYFRQVYGARVSPAGTVLDPDGIPIAQGAYRQYAPAVAFGGGNFLVTWQDYRRVDTFDIYGARVTPDGVVLDTQGIAIGRAAYDLLAPAIAFDGANFLVVWSDDQVRESSLVYGARVTPGGIVLDTSSVLIAQTSYAHERPAVAFDGSNFLVAWGDYRNGSSDIYGARVTPEGIVLDTGGFAVSRGARECLPALAFDGTNFLAVWEDGRSRVSRNIYAARVARAGAVLDTVSILLTTGANHQNTPAAAFDGTNFLVVWLDYRNGDTLDVYGARVSPAGVLLDPLGIAISTAMSDPAEPAVAFNGTNFFVVWHAKPDSGAWNDWNVYGARVTPEGVVLDTSAITISGVPEDQRAPAVASDGTGFLVAWRDSRGGQTDIYGARVTPEGIVLDTNGIVVSQADMNQQDPTVAFDGENYMVAWSDEDMSTSDIDGARVTPEGTVLDTAGILLSRGGWQFGSQPTIAFDGEDYLVVWAAGTYTYSHICAVRVTPEGIVLDTNGITISGGGHRQGSPVVAFDGTGYLVVWQDDRGGHHSDIYGARVSPAGVVSDSGPFVRQEGVQTSPALCSGSGQLFLVYQGWTGTVGGQVYDAERIWGRMNPVPGVEERENSEVRRVKAGTTIVRGVLFLPAKGEGQGAKGELLDAAGRKVMDLQPGANDVRHLAGGVYFVRAAQAQAQAQTVHKVVIQR